MSKVVPTVDDDEVVEDDSQASDASNFFVQPVQIDWRKLVLFFFLAMVLPTLLALALDWWLSLFPYMTIAVILICFPLATIMGMRMTLKEINRVIDEVAPPSLELEIAQEDDGIDDIMAPEGIVEAGIKEESSSKP